ncbi:cyclopropane-fatty-acyl-phospholipid synthase [Paraphaeosphaeria sporulosa]
MDCVRSLEKAGFEAKGQVPVFGHLASGRGEADTGAASESTAPAPCIAGTTIGSATVLPQRQSLTSAGSGGGFRPLPSPFELSIWHLFLAWFTVASSLGSACYQIVVVKNLNATPCIDGVGSRYRVLGALERNKEAGKSRLQGIPRWFGVVGT